MSVVPELSVSNFTQSLEFYSQVLGFKVLYQRPEEGFAYLKLGAAELMIDQIGQTRDWLTAPLEYPFGRGINLQIMVENLEPIMQNLASRGIALFMPLEEKWYRKDNLEVGNRQFLVQDPDGYLLRLAVNLGERELMQTEHIKAFVMAGHGNLEKIKTMLLEQPALLEQAFEWREGDFETALQASSHVGNAEIAKYLLQHGAKPEITTAAMLGDTATVEAMLLERPALIQQHGAHGISLLTHAVMSGDAGLVQGLIAKGATSGADMALNIATDCDFFEVVKVLLPLNPNPNWKNIKSKTALELAANQPEILALLESKGHHA